jgi:hypothetical protein
LFSDFRSGKWGVQQQIPPHRLQKQSLQIRLIKEVSVAAAAAKHHQASKLLLPKQQEKASRCRCLQKESKQESMLLLLPLKNVSPTQVCWMKIELGFKRVVSFLSASFPKCGGFLAGYTGSSFPFPEKDQLQWLRRHTPLI